MTERKMPNLESIASAICSPINAPADVPQHHTPLPSLVELDGMIETLRAVLFPGFHGMEALSGESLKLQTTAALDSVFRTLVEQIRLGICFSGKPEVEDCSFCTEFAWQAASSFMEELPGIRELLWTDVIAAYEGDPAAKNPAETIFCYPSIRAMTNHRVAHALYKLRVPVIPRIIGEMAHSRTGIDVHPGAEIGSGFFIDHGTGVVIGETCIIGSNCRLYQGVTLGALSFPKDADGNPVKGLARHPILEDNVIVYAGATILGRVTIGKGSVIGGNVWLTHDVPPDSKIFNKN